MGRANDNGHLVQSKDCSKCKIIKPLTEYHKASDGSRFGVRSVCKACRKIEGAEYGKKNREKITKQTAAWAKANPERARRNRINWRRKNKDRLNEEARKWRAENRELARKVAREASRKRRATPGGKLEDSIRRRINECIAKGSKFGRKTFDLLGYTVEEVKRHLEKRFEPGMSWDNHGVDGWEIDHIIPLDAHNYNTPDDIDFKKAWALKNLQPLWHAENRSKRAKLSKPFQPSLALAANDTTKIADKAI